MRRILYFALRWLYRVLALTPKWSALRTLGQSRLLALTALVPFLGSLLIFNQQLVDVFSISPALIAKWIGAAGQVSEADAKSFTISRLQLTYFGLCFLGVASFLFTILCPAEIKKTSSISSYIETELPLVTTARTSLLAQDVAQDFLRYHGDDEATRPAILRVIAYPDDQVSLFDSVFREISENIGWADDPVPEPAAQEPHQNHSLELAHTETSADSISEMGLLSISGEYLTHKVASVIHNRRRVEKFFWASFEASAENHKTDLLTLRYLAQDHSRPSARMIVTGCYGVGFAILFYPTAWTFVRIVARLIGT